MLPHCEYLLLKQIVDRRTAPNSGLTHEFKAFMTSRMKPFCPRSALGSLCLAVYICLAGASKRGACPRVSIIPPSLSSFAFLSLGAVRRGHLRLEILECSEWSYNWLAQLESAPSHCESLRTTRDERYPNEFLIFKFGSIAIMFENSHYGASVALPLCGSESPAPKSVSASPSSSCKPSLPALVENIRKLLLLMR